MPNARCTNSKGNVSLVRVFQATRSPTPSSDASLTTTDVAAPTPLEAATMTSTIRRNVINHLLEPVQRSYPSTESTTITYSCDGPSLRTSYQHQAACTLTGCLRKQRNDCLSVGNEVFGLKLKGHHIQRLFPSSSFSSHFCHFFFAAISQVEHLLSQLLVS